MALQLRQVEVRTRAVGHQLLGVMEKEQSEVEERARDRFIAEQYVLFVQMPAARAHQQRGSLLIELVLLAFRTGEFDGPADRVTQIDLAFEVVAPGGRVRVFKVRHEDVRAAIERVDDHFTIHRPRDLNAAIDKIVRDGSNRPFAEPDVSSFRKEVRKMAGVELRLAQLPAGQKILPASLEFRGQRSHEAASLRSQNLGIRRTYRSVNLK